MVSRNQGRPEVSDRSNIVSVTIGVIILLVLVVLFLKRKSNAEERVRDVESELRDEDEMFNILADGQRDPKKEGTDGQKDKRSFLSKFRHFSKRALIWFCYIFVISAVIIYGCCAACVSCPRVFIPDLRNESRAMLSCALCPPCLCILFGSLFIFCLGVGVLGYVLMLLMIL